MKNPTDNNDTRAGRYQRLMSLFDALCEQTYQEQRAALQQVGLTDTKMAAELRSMLAEDAGALAPRAAMASPLISSTIGAPLPRSSGQLRRP